MSIVTQHADRVDIAWDRLRPPVIEAPRPKQPAKEPDDSQENHRRASGARCRIAMGFLD